MTFYIGFETALKPRGKIDENYTELRDHLNSNDFVCYNFLELPITQESLKPYDILVFVCPDFAKISNQEINEIENWVREDGGGLLLLSHAGGDRGRNSNLSELSERFGIAFENDQVLDETQNIGMENLPIIYSTSFIPPHPITNDIDSVCYRAGCSLSVLGGAFSIASSNDTSEPFSCPLICVAEPDNGRVVAIGSYEMFRDRIGGGLSHDYHAQLALNIFNWLTTDYRIELRSGAPVSVPAAVSEATNIATFSPSKPNVPGQTSLNIPTSFNIASKDDLINTLNNILSQINGLKSTVEQLISATNSWELSVGSAPPVYEGYEGSYPEHGQADYSGTTAAPVKNLNELNPAPLSALPPKPPALLKGAPVLSEEDFIGLEPVKKGVPEEIPEEVGTVEEPVEEPEPEPEPAPVKKEINKEEMLAEIEGLESKLNSFFNLMSFIEKKHTSGNMKDTAYKKQSDKLKKDIDKTKKRIEEITKQLGG